MDFKLSIANEIIFIWNRRQRVNYCFFGAHRRINPRCS